MNNFAKILLPAVFFVSACGGEKPTEYVFDSKDLEANLENYGNNLLGCGFMSLIFTKEMMVAVKNSKEPNLEESKNWSPTSVNLYKDKVEWIDLGRETPIKNGFVTLDFSNADGEAMELQVLQEGERLFFGVEDKETKCKMPFKKVK